MPQGKTTTVSFTHKGLAFGFYPILMDEDQEIITSRKYWPEFLLTGLISIYGFFYDLHNPFDLEMGIPVSITGKLEKPITLDLVED